VSICRPSCAGGEPMKGLAQNAPEAAPAIRRADAEPRASSSTTRPGTRDLRVRVSPSAPAGDLGPIGIVARGLDLCREPSRPSIRTIQFPRGSFVTREHVHRRARAWLPSARCSPQNPRRGQPRLSRLP
jgi:hypothetical protein